MSIRNGAFQNVDGTYRPDFFEIVRDFEKRLAYAKKHTSLPEKLDLKRIEEFMISVNEKAVLGGSSLSDRLQNAAIRSEVCRSFRHEPPCRDFAPEGR